MLEERELKHMKNMQAVSVALSDIYTGVIWIDLQEDTFSIIKSPDVISKMLRSLTSAQEAMAFAMRNTVQEDGVEAMYAFTDLLSLPERMGKEKYINTEYLGKFSGWVRGSFVEVTRNEEGVLTQVLYTYQLIDEEKRMQLDYQEAYQKKFRENVEKLDLERQYLNVLTQDYVLVYDVDLFSDRAEVIKIMAHSHVQNMKGMHLGTHFVYSAHIVAFAEQYVISNKADYLKKLHKDYILQQMKKTSRYSFRFDSIMNSAGNMHYEVQVVRANPYVFDGRVLIVSREIDDIIEKEKQHQEELDAEREYLELLTQDLIVAYHVNLKENESTLIKVDRKVERYHAMQPTVRSKNNYQERIVRYCQKMVVPNLRAEFQRIMSSENIREKLKNSFRFVYRYRTVQQNGHQFYEAQVFRMDDELENVLIGFRCIDDVVTAEQKHQIELEERYEREQNQNEVMAALGRGYQAILRIDLRKDSYERIACHEDVIHFYDSKETSAARALGNLCENAIDERFVDRMRQFFDLRTLPLRLRDTDSAEIECIVKDGNWHRARFIVKRRDQAGEAVSVLYVTQVIDEEKQYQERLLSRAENADTANRAKTEFISQLAHDIRTPMNAMLGFLEIARANPEDTEKVSYALDKMHQSGVFLRELVTDVLDIAKMESKKIQLQPEETSLQEIFEEVITSVINEQTKKKYQFSVDMDLSYDCIIADRLRLKQIYANILSNAVKYTPEGGKILLKAYEQEVQGEDRVRLIVRIQDNGIGMSEEFMAKMFQEYERAVDTRINTVSGYGLGLSIVKRLVNIMEGTIEVQSKLGEGSSFTVCLEVPYVTEPAREENIRKPDYTKDCEGMHLLVAEDNELNREVITELLKMYGITCECAENGEICLRMLQTEPEGTFDGILMDMQMPVMNGLDATRRIRALSSSWTKTIPIIAMTANAMKEDVENCIRAGMNAHLSKPIEKEKMLELLAKFR